jgi:hypothetical protein
MPTRLPVGLALFSLAVACDTEATRVAIHDGVDAPPAALETEPAAEDSEVLDASPEASAPKAEPSPMVASEPLDPNEPAAEPPPSMPEPTVEPSVTPSELEPIAAPAVPGVTPAPTPEPVATQAPDDPSADAGVPQGCPRESTLRVTLDGVDSGTTTVQSLYDAATTHVSLEVRNHRTPNPDDVSTEGHIASLYFTDPVITEFPYVADITDVRFYYSSWARMPQIHMTNKPSISAESQMTEMSGRVEVTRNDFEIGGLLCGNAQYHAEGPDYDGFPHVVDAELVFNVIITSDPTRPCADGAGNWALGDDNLFLTLEPDCAISNFCDIMNGIHTTGVLSGPTLVVDGGVDGTYFFDFTQTDETLTIIDGFEGQDLPLTRYELPLPDECPIPEQ